MAPVRTRTRQAKALLSPVRAVAERRVPTGVGRQQLAVGRCGVVTRTHMQTPPCAVTATRGTGHMWSAADAFGQGAHRIVRDTALCRRSAAILHADLATRNPVRSADTLSSENPSF